MRVRGELDALGAVEVREEHEPALVEAAEEHRAGGHGRRRERPAVAQRHRASGWRPGRPIAPPDTSAGTGRSGSGATRDRAPRDRSSGGRAAQPATVPDGREPCQTGGMAFHHVAIATRDLDATHRFYTEAMGFTLVRVEAAAVQEHGWARHLFYDTGNGEMIAIWDLHDETPARLRSRDLDRARPAELREPHRVRRADLDDLDDKRDRWLEHGYDVVRDRPRLVHVDLRQRPQRDHGRVLRDDARVHRRRPPRGAGAAHRRAVPPLNKVEPPDRSSSKPRFRRRRHRLAARRSRRPCSPASVAQHRVGVARRARDRRCASAPASARASARRRPSGRRRRSPAARRTIMSRAAMCVDREVGRGVDEPDGNVVRARGAPAASSAVQRRGPRRDLASSASWPRRARFVRREIVARGRGGSIATHRRANTASALAAITTSRPSAVGYAFDGATPGRTPPLASAHHAAELEVGDRRLHQREHRLVDRDVDLLAPPATRAVRAPRRACR